MKAYIAQHASPWKRITLAARAPFQPLELRLRGLFAFAPPIDIIHWYAIMQV
jgi:hypothetical protein